MQGVPPRGGLVTSLAFRGAVAMARAEEHLGRLRSAGVFVLPLSAMEFAQFLPEASTLQAGFRLGLGAPEDLFAEALEVMERTLS